MPSMVSTAEVERWRGRYVSIGCLDDTLSVLSHRRPRQKGAGATAHLAFPSPIFCVLPRHVSIDICRLDQHGAANPLVAIVPGDGGYRWVCRPARYCTASPQLQPRRMPRYSVVTCSSLSSFYLSRFLIY